MHVVEKMEGIIRESVKPMERIESIKIMQLDGFAGVGGSGGPGNTEPGQGGITDGIVNSALRYRAQAPIVDQLLKEIGLDGKELAQGTMVAFPASAKAADATDQKGG